MNDQTLNERLTHVANKLRHLWGRNPDSDTIEEAIALLREASVAPVDTPAETPAEEPTPARRGRPRKEA
jgi:hypothetical protein